MSKLEIELWMEGEDMKCSHDIANINGDPRTPLLLVTLKTMKGTTKQKLDKAVWVIRNSTILAMAQQEAENQELTALHYQDQVKDLVIVSQDTMVKWKG